MNFKSLKLAALYLFDVILILCITFVGDYSVYYVPLFFPFWLLVMARKGMKVVKSELICQIFLFVLFLPVMLRPSRYSNSIEYYISSFYPFLYVNVLYFSLKVLNKLQSHKLALETAKWLCFLSLTGVGLLTLGLSETRNSFVFGPNVYYRLLGVVALFYLFLIKSTLTQSRIATTRSFIFNQFASFFLVAVSIFCLFKTGSRGSLFVIAFLLLTASKNLMSFEKRQLTKLFTFSYIFLIVPAMLSSNYIFESLGQRFDGILQTTYAERFFRFSFGEGSSSASFDERHYFYDLLPKFLESENSIFGEGTVYIDRITDGVLFYPHNLYLDLVYNSGSIVTLIFIVFSCLYVLCFARNRLTPPMKDLTVMLFPIYMGSQSSGTLFDNYPVLAMMIAFPIACYCDKKGKAAKIVS
jgi:hypothetical protein